MMKQHLPKKARLLFLIYALRKFILRTTALVGLYYLYTHFITLRLNLPNTFMPWLASLLIFLGLSATLDLIFRPTLYYKAYQYEFTDSLIYLKEGYFKIYESYFPMERLQKVECYSGPLMRYFSLKGLTLHSAGSTLSITALDEKEADKLSSQLILKINTLLEEEKNASEE